MSSNDAPSVPTRLGRLRALGFAAPRPRIAFALPLTPRDGLRRVLPLRRWRRGIVVLGMLCAVMSIPLLAVGVPRLGATPQLADVSLVLFQSFWLLGWTVAVAVPALGLAALLLGREVLTLRPGLLQLRLEVLGLGLGAEYPAAEVRELRRANGSEADGTHWRGAHLVFDFHGVPVPFGSDLEPARADQLRIEVQQVLATPPAADFILPAAPRAPTPAAVVAAPADAVSPYAPTASRIALLALVAANLLPLLGVLTLDWKVGDILLVYWAESVIIGLISIAKLVLIGRWAAAFYAPFFLGHYGAFMAMHLLFVYTFFLRVPHSGGAVALSEVATTLRHLWPALLGLAASHLLSFLQNFVGRREYTRVTLAQQMHAPYRRVLIMQLTIILGGMLTLALDSMLPALLLMIVLKLLLDVNAHRNERRRAGSGADDLG